MKRFKTRCRFSAKAKTTYNARIRTATICLGSSDFESSKMGCASSVPRVCTGNPANSDKPILSALLLTPQQKQFIRNSWKLIHRRRTEVGVKVFLTLFKKDPALQNMFSEFRELKLEELEQTRELRGHTERVMRAVENSLNAMEDPDSLREYLVELGRRHVMRSAKPSVGNLHLLSRALLSTFQETIPAEWLPEVAAAWEILLNYFAMTLKEGIRSGSVKSLIV